MGYVGEKEIINKDVIKKEKFFWKFEEFIKGGEMESDE